VTLKHFSDMPKNSCGLKFSY